MSSPPPFSTATGAAPPPPPAVAAVFGAELVRATAYAELLCTAGVQRGLLGPQEPDRIWTRHLVNAALLAELVPPGATVVDVGSGAGLPGIPLWLARPDLDMTLAEPLLRRSTFLGEVVAALDLPIEVRRARAEELPAGTWDVAVARAVAPLVRLVPLTCRLVRPGGIVLALKGRRVEVEIHQARQVIERWSARQPEVNTLGTAESATTVVRIERRGEGGGRS